MPNSVGGATSIFQVNFEIYRVFPQDSDTIRTPAVPTRVNSPSDIVFDSRSSATAGQLSFTSTVLNPSFTVANSVGPGGIHPSPNQFTGGNGPITGQEVQLNVTFTTPLNLAANHYFFIPPVTLTNGGQFYWLSAARPATTPFVPDLQAWTRDNALDPDWLRIGTDIVGGDPRSTWHSRWTVPLFQNRPVSR